MGNGFVQKGDSNLQEGIRSRRKLWVSGADRYPTGIILTNRNPGLRWQAYDFPDRIGVRPRRSPEESCGSPCRKSVPGKICTFVVHGTETPYPE